MKPVFWIVIYSVIWSLLSGCGDLGYYSQGIGGHLSMMSKRQPITDLLVDPATEKSLKKNLQQVMAARQFAEDELHLPVGDNFGTYVDAGRPYVVWNVVAAPAYSLASYEWCYPITGCLPYRGYFTEKDADGFADSLRVRGLDAYVYGVPAYSTLGWFDDPVLNTFIHYPETALVGLMFHELAHQLIYAESDGDFNEAFATAVEREGVRRWLLLNRSEKERDAYDLFHQREEDFFSLISNTREELLGCYDGRLPYSLAQRKTCKEKAFSEMKENYHLLKENWGNGGYYDHWFEPGLNNARFVSSHTYRFYVPAFEELLRKHDGYLPAFYAEVKRLAALPSGERRIALSALRKAAIAAITDTSATSPGALKKLTPKSGI